MTVTAGLAGMAARRSQRLVIGGAAGSLLVVLLVARGWTGTRSAADILADLSHTSGYRVIEPRLSLPAPYAPFRLTAAREPRGSASLRLLSELSKARPSDPGLTRLLLGEWDTAIKDLQSGPAIDQSAAYYMRGVATDSLLDFCHAWDSLRSAGASAEVVFNRALILEQLTDDEAAAEEWQQYLKIDAHSPWAAEARAHLARVRQPSVASSWKRDQPILLKAAGAGDAAAVHGLIARYPLASRRMAELELLPTWGEALLRGDKTAAEHALGSARMIVAQRPILAEKVLEDAVGEIDRALAAGSAFPLARAYAAYRKANDAMDVSNHAEALRLYSESLQSAGPGASAFRAVVLPNVVTAHYRRYEHPAAEALIATARHQYRDQRSRYLSLFARLDWLAGLMQIAQPNASEALRFYRQALDGYERLGEAEYCAAQHINLADSYIYLGDSEHAAVHVRRALLLVTRAEDPRRLQGILKVAATLTGETSGPASAVVFEDRLVRAARAVGDPMRVPDALVSRSAALSRAGRRDEASRDLAEVRRLAPHIADAPTRERMEADASAAEALAYRGFDDRRVVESLSGAIDRFRSLSMRAFIAQLLRERGRAYLRLSDAAAAERDFRSAIEVLETQRALVREAPLRISYFDAAEGTFVDLALLLLSRGRLADAFDLLERARSRELLDRATGGAVRPLSLAEIRARLPENVTLVTHTVHGQGLVTFVVTRASVRAFHSDAGPSILGPLVDTISSRFASGKDLPAETLRRLGAILVVDPVERESGRRLVFVPDQVLAGVPFPALRLADGSYLVESHPIAISPSATMLVKSTPRGHPVPPGQSRSILIVASRERPLGFGDLPPLDRTFDEARQVAAIYAKGRVFSTSNLDAGSVLQEARTYDIFHFGGHSVVDPRAPAHSALLIGARGRITVADIEAADLSNLELVVLGGCNTAMGKGYRSEGPLSLARAFMAAGVPSVLSTITRIEDDTAERLLTDFHRHYANGLDAPDALREAQLLMLHGSDARNATPVHWGGFQITGGGRTDRR
ncbi:MAG: CHAT domain-containing protein [Acidobacteriota bacterium]